MALIKCYECGKEISNAANKCPHCGAPTNPDAQSMQDVGTGLNGIAYGCSCFGTLLIIIGVILFLLATCSGLN